MRKKDIPVILVTAFFAGVVAYLTTNFVISPDSERVEQVEVVKPISSEFKPVDERYFNNDSINPTKIIEIGGGDIDTEEDDEED